MRVACRLAEDEVAVHDLRLVAVERAHRRAGRAAALEVVLPAVAGAGEGALEVAHRAAEVHARVGDGGELAVAVVADEDDAPVDARRVVGLRLEGDDLERVRLVLREVVGRAEVDLVEARRLEDRRQHEGERRHGDDGAHDGADADRGAGEEARAVHRGARARGVGLRRAGQCGARDSATGSGVGARVSAARPRRGTPPLLPPGRDDARH